MKVETGTGLLYDSKRPECQIKYSAVFHRDIGNQCYAYISCIDIRGGDVAYYWGPWYHSNPRLSIRLILEKGGKWPQWPCH